MTSIPANAAAANRIRLAVLGDSDSQSYQDDYSFPPGSTARGGAFHRSTLQWTEILVRLRSARVDMGPWGEWGQRRSFARVLDWLGLPSRSPIKQDYSYNVAVSGAVCDDLVSGVYRQAPRLADLMAQEPDPWRTGIVVIRMGGNDIGNHHMLELMAQDPNAPAVKDRSANCVNRIQEAIHLLRAVQPKLRFVIVSPMSDTDDPNNKALWNSAREQANLELGFSYLQNALRDMAARDSAFHFIDDVQWFRSRWGGRDASGKPDYKTVRIGDVLAVTNTTGDDPRNSTLNDDHAGLAFNALYAQFLVDELNSAWKLDVPPISEAELSGFIKPLIQPKQVLP
jgi:lysophospholipase L1-like esterase